jgi:DNA-binding NtrC family response regulator
MLAMQELEAIKQALAKYNGHREKTARELGISRRALQYKLNKFQLQIEKRSDGAGLRGGL